MNNDNDRHGENTNGPVRGGESGPARPDDRMLERLLKTAGRGPSASPEARQRIYAAVHEAWRDRAATIRSRPAPDATARGRRRAAAAGRERRPSLQRRFVPLGLAAALAVATVATVLFGPAPIEPGASFAAVTKLQGNVSVSRGNETIELEADGVTLDALRIGDSIRTAGGAGLALALPGGEDFRIGAGSELRLAALDRVRLVNGAVYFDSNSGPGGSPLVVETAFGSVRHTGTQYLAEVENDGLVVSVREGSVEVRDDDSAYVAGAGDALKVTRSGAPMRMTISSTDPAWRWAERLAGLPDGHSEALFDILSWIAEETGRRLEFADPEAEARARSVRMSGLAGLSPTQALDAVVQTTALAIRAADDEGRLVVASP